MKQSEVFNYSVKEIPSPSGLEKFRDVHTLMFDVDGVLTNSELIVLESGKLLRKMNTRDGLALKLAVKAGLKVVIITGGKSEGVVTRLKNLGVSEVHAGISDKLQCYEEYLLLNTLSEVDEEGILYMGDDLPDYEVMTRVGLACCPQDAAIEITDISRYISPKKGGEGCVRDVIEKVLKLKGKWPADKVGTYNIQPL